MTQQQQELDWKEILRQAGPYPIEAFNFVREGLCYTAQHTHEDFEDLPEADRHISGQQLCLGLRDYAIERYGLLAPTVLFHWHIRRTDDFGRIVFAMINAGLMTKTEDDHLEDFRGVYDFDEAFSEDELAARLGLN
ncbi:MAG: Minf_1886 family protein [Planctomycetota bacterium]